MANWNNIRNEILTQVDTLGASFVRLVFHDCFNWHKDFRGGNFGAGGGAVQFLTAGALPANQLLEGGGIAQNAGLDIPINFLNGLKQRHHVSLADLIVFAATTAIQRFGGPNIPFLPGRTDHSREDVAQLMTFHRDRFGNDYKSFILPKPNHPDKVKLMYEQKFNFTLRDFTILNGAHTLGGTSFPDGVHRTWNLKKNDFSNAYYVNLIDLPWVKTASSGEGKLIWKDGPNDSLILLETDFCLKNDIRGALKNQFTELHNLCVTYRNNQNQFFNDFAGVYTRLTTAGWHNLGQTGAVTPGQRYRIVNKKSNLTLDFGANSHAGSVLTQQPDAHNARQRFLLESGPGGSFVIRCSTGRVFDVNGGSVDNLASIIEWDLHGADNQLWLLENKGGNSYVIRSRKSGRVLDVEGGNTAAGARIIQFDFHGGDNQIFNFVRVEE